jgi:hypothetical protein
MASHVEPDVALQGLTNPGVVQALASLQQPLVQLLVTAPI